MRRADIAELPGARRAWMGPPSAALGLKLPRTPCGPLQNRCAHPTKPFALRLREPLDSERELYATRSGLAHVRHSTTSRDGVAHEAPLSTVWRLFGSARARCAVNAATRARLEVGAPVAQHPTTPSPK